MSKINFQKVDELGKLSTRLASSEADRELFSVELKDGNSLIFPGESLFVGDVTVMRDANGNEVTSKSGKFETANGFTITIEDGVIKEAINPDGSFSTSWDEFKEAEKFNSIVEQNKTKKGDTKESENGSTDSNESFDQNGSNTTTTLDPQILELLNKQTEVLSNQAEQIKKLQSAMNSGMPLSTTPSAETKGSSMKVGDNRKYSKGALLEFVSKYKEIKKDTKNFNRLKREYEYRNADKTQFAPGWDLAGVVARCKDYMEDITYLTIVNDGLLSIFNNVTAQATGPNVNKYSVYIPRLDYSLNENLWQQVAKTCGFNPQDDFQPTQREIEVYGIQYEHENCAIDARSVFNGMIYTGDEEIPAEAVAMTLLIERLARDLEKVALYGRGSIKGLFQEIQDAVVASCIPADQSITQVPYTVANSIDQIEALIDAVPPFLRANTDLMAMVQYNLPSLYYRNYRTAFGAPPQFGYPLAPQDGMMELIPDTPFPVAWMKSYSQGLETVGTDIVNITFPENIYYVLEKGGGADDFNMWYDDREQTVSLRWRNCFGINFALCEGIVTNITAATVLP